MPKLRGQCRSSPITLDESRKGQNGTVLRFDGCGSNRSDLDADPASLDVCWSSTRLEEKEKGG